ncbi:type II toxin-antitoxin system PemK/MazF family toxin [Cellulomonas sp. NPDC057328]|uniref:type II toxin-antitoxin system PemK/MazF family toxin n=1 Tax=Cellulomonas sp. NPDC057328 TaxID=3346101 RepID=UPI0036339194
MLAPSSPSVTVSSWLGDPSSVPAPVVVAALVVVLLVAAAVLRGRGRGRGRGRRGRRPRPGEIWFAWVPFEDGGGGKDRPVLVLRRAGRRVAVARFTSQDKGSRRDHVRVPGGVPGLSRDSWLDLRPRTLPRRAFRRRAGDAGDALVSWYDDARASATP